MITIAGEHNRDRFAICRKCNRKGHFSKACKAVVSAVGELHEDEFEEEISDNSRSIFLGEIVEAASSDPWIAHVRLKGKSVQLKIDTGPNVTVVPNTFANPTNNNDNSFIALLRYLFTFSLKSLVKFTGWKEHKPLENRGPELAPLQVQGKFKALLRAVLTTS